MKQKLLGWLSFSKSLNAEIIYLLIVTCIWMGMVILVNPIGDFPLNDDWAYGFSVKSLVEEGDLKISAWTATNLFSHIFLGALFCLPFGFSFTALRVSTLTLGLIGIITTYGLLREVNLPRKFALYGALIVAVNPIYFGLANTFMTDVPFFAIGILSIYFLIRGLRLDSTFETIIGILFACVSLLIRQLAFAIFLAFGCAYVIKKGAIFKNFIKGFSPTILGILIQLSYQGWLRATRQVSELQGKQIKDILIILSRSNLLWVIEFFMRNTALALLYLGLFMLLFTLVLYPIKFQQFYFRDRKQSLVAALIIFILFAVAVISKGFQIPITRNILSEFGLGPLTLRDGYILNNLPVPEALKIFWLIITSVSIVGAVLLILYLVFALKEILSCNDSSYQINQKWLKALIISTICIYYFPLGIGGFFDRYLIFLVPFFMMLVAVYTVNINLHEKFEYRLVCLAMIMLLFSGWFTIGATHDYLSWNRVRWQALENLMQESKISPNYIDGGYEFNGWYLYSIKYKGKREKSWWWVDKDDYMVSFNAIDGYKEVKRYPFKKWLPFGPTNILVSRKNTADSIQSQ